MRISPTSIRRFGVCRARWSLRRRGAPRSLPGDMLRHGRRAHEMIERALRGDPPARPPGGGPDPAWDAYQAWNRWWARRQPRHAEVIGIEQGMMVGLPGGHEAGGIADLIVRRGAWLGVYDWKTGWAPVAPLADDAQARLLALLALCSIEGTRDCDVTIVNVRGPSARTRRWRESDVPDLVAWAADRAAAMARAAAATDPEPTPGPWCVTCSVAAACPLSGSPHLSMVPTTAEGAERIARIARASRAALDAANASLRAWCAVHGPLEDGVGFRPAAPRVAVRGGAEWFLGMDPTEAIDSGWLVPSARALRKDYLLRNMLGDDLLEEETVRWEGP